MTYSGITSGSKDFNPDPTPAYSDRLRDLHNSLETNIDRFNQSVNANDQTRMLNAKNAGEDLRALGKLSGTLGSVLGAVQEQRIKRFQNEATVFNELGIDTQEKLDAARAKQDELESELDESTKATDNLVRKAEENGERMSVVQGIRRLNGYHIAELKKSGIVGAVNDFNSNLGKNSAAYFAENDLTLEQKKAYIKSQGADFLNGLADNYSTSLIAKYAIPAYTKAKNTEIKLLEDANDRDQSIAIRSDAEANLIDGGSLDNFVSNVSHTKDNQGNYLGRSGALDQLADINTKQGQAGNFLDLEALGEEIVNGKPFKEHPRFAKLEQDQEDIKRGRFKQDEELKAIAIRQKELDFNRIVQENQGVRFTPEQIYQMQQDASKDTNYVIAPHEFTFYQEYLTRTENRDNAADERIIQTQLQVGVGRGYLIQSDLDNVSPELAAKYQTNVDEAQANGLAKPPAGVAKAAEGHISSMANAITNEAVGVDDVGSTDYQTVIANVRSEYTRMYQGHILDGASPEKAHQLARKDQLELLKSVREEQRDKDGNTFTRSQLYHTIGFGNDVELDHRVAEEINNGRKYLQQAQQGTFDLTTTVIPGTEAHLKQLESFQNTGEIPDYYHNLARGHKKLTPWDLANMQYRAHTGKELGKDSRREAYEKAEPALQQVLTEPFSTKSRIFRSQSNIDYNSPALTNSPLSESMSRKADIVGKYESDSVGGYNAVNQIGIDGGNATEGYSGDIRNMSQHSGRALTDMTIGEIIDLQAELDVTNAQWISQGRLHAVGRYQFTRDTFRELISTLGFSRSRKFDKSTQDQMFASLWKSGGPGRWVGLKHATPEELAELNS